MTRRRPVRFAGRLYPADPDVLSRELAATLAAGCPSPASRVLLLPHGGGEGSAASLGVGLARLPPGTRAALVVGPAHAPPEDGAVLLDDRSAWETPLGPVELLDPALVAAALEGAGAPVRVDRAAHDREHALEGLVAALALRAPACRILPVLLPVLPPPRVLVTLARRTACEDAMDAVLATTDLDHYHEGSAGLGRHRRVAELLEDGGPSAWYAALASGAVAPCGGAAAGVFLEAAREQERAVRVLAYGWAGPAPGRLGTLAAGAFPPPERAE